MHAHELVGGDTARQRAWGKGQPPAAGRGQAAWVMQGVSPLPTSEPYLREIRLLEVPIAIGHHTRLGSAHRQDAGLRCRSQHQS